MKFLNSIQTVWQLITKAPQGTPPLVVDSSTKVEKLNADMVDGKDASDFAESVHGHDASNVTSGTLNAARIPTVTHGMTNFADQGLNKSDSVQFENVGVGTSTPGEKLDVQGNIKASGSYKFNNEASIEYNEATKSIDFTFD